MSEQTDEIQARLRRKYVAALVKARELREKYPDPVVSISDLLAELPIDDDVRQEILEEPYG